MVTLHNAGKRMLCMNLDHGFFETEGDDHKFRLIHVTVVDHDGKSGKLFPRRVPKIVPSSLTLTAGEVRSGLPDEILLCTDVKNAVASGALRQTTVANETTPPTTTTDETKPAGKKTAKESTS